MSDFAEFIKAACEQAEQSTAHLPRPIASVWVSLEGQAIEIRLATEGSDYSEWIEGEGGDICLLRDLETHRVVGARLPLYARTLMLSCGDADVTFNIPQKDDKPQPLPAGPQEEKDGE